MTALTPENARPGLRVKCVDPNNLSMPYGHEYVIRRVERDREFIEVEGDDYVHLMRRFVLAEPARPTLRALLAEHDPEFLAAVVEWDNAYSRSADADRKLRSRLALSDAIERANLHAPAEVQAPGVTDARASISEGWWA